jgi:DNA-binding beta-propeller fold protein YncE
MKMKFPARGMLCIVSTLLFAFSITSICADTVYVCDGGAGAIFKYSTNGTGGVFARNSLSNPQGMIFDKAGNLYVANAANNTITKYAANGAASTFAADPGDNSVLSYPEGLAFDTNGNLYAANSASDTIEKFTTNGVASLFVADPGDHSALNSPEGLAFNTNGNLYVANNDFIEEFSSSGANLGTFGDFSYLNAPVGLAFDTNGNLYVANSLEADEGPTIVKFDPAGNGSVFFSTGLDEPEFLTFDTNGNLFVANDGNSNNIEEIMPDGVMAVVNDVNVINPQGVALDHAGHIFDDNDGISEFIEEFDSSGDDLGMFAISSLGDPRAMDVDSFGNLYVDNYYDGTVEKFDTNGNPSLFAQGILGAYGLVVDSSNNLYVASSYLNEILRITTNGAVSLFSSSNLGQPTALVLDNSGNLYALNSFSNNIVEFSPDGSSSSVFATDPIPNNYGPGMAIDSDNNIYVLTNFYGVGLGEYSPAGVLSPFATNTAGGTFTQANAQGMAFDSYNNLYVANYYSGNVEEFDTSGNGTVFAGGFDAPVSVAILHSSNTSPNSVTPSLSITQSGTNVLLTWTLSAPNCTLQSNTSLSSANWVNVPGTPGTYNGNCIVTNAITGLARYYRLQLN